MKKEKHPMAASTAENELSETIDVLTSKINDLENHLWSIKNQPKPSAAPSEDPMNVDEVIKNARIFAEQAAEQAARREVEVTAVEQAMTVLKARLREAEQTQTKLKCDAALGQLKTKAEKFNALIDEAVRVLDEMKLVKQEIRTHTSEFNPLVISANLNDLAYCSINPTIIRVRCRLDVLTDQNNRKRG